MVCYPIWQKHGRDQQWTCWFIQEWNTPDCPDCWHSSVWDHNPMRSVCRERMGVSRARCSVILCKPEGINCRDQWNWGDNAWGNRIPFDSGKTFYSISQLKVHSNLTFYRWFLPFTTANILAVTWMESIYLSYTTTSFLYSGQRQNGQLKRWPFGIRKLNT